VIAHNELAHLLFRSSDHGTGLMKVEWSPDDMVRIGQRPAEVLGRTGSTFCTLDCGPEPSLERLLAQNRNQ